MNDQRLELLPGQHTLARSIEDCRVDSYDLEHSRVKLHLAVESPEKTGSRGRGTTALTIYIKKDAAVKLLSDLTKLSNQMTWEE
jgi:hypothetical protein